MAAYGATLTSSAPMNDPKTRGKFFFAECVIVSVENVLHRLPRQRLEAFSDVFRDMFSLPQGGRDREGSSEENPIVLAGCTNFQFESLMEILFPSTIPYTNLAKDELVAALELADKWEMEEVKKLIISQLTSKHLSPTEKVILGQKFSIPPFLKQGFIELIKSPTLPPLSDIHTLGWATLGRIAYTRDTLLTGGSGPGKVSIETKALKCTYCPGKHVQVHCRSGKHRKAAEQNERFLDPGMVYAEHGWYAPTRGVRDLSSVGVGDEEDLVLDAKIWESFERTG